MPKWFSLYDLGTVWTLSSSGWQERSAMFPVFEIPGNEQNSDILGVERVGASFNW